jgi:Peptidase family S41
MKKYKIWMSVICFGWFFSGFITQTFAQKSTPYLLNFKHKDIGEVRMLLYINIVDTTFEAATRPDADIDFFGGNKMKLVRKMSNFKDGSLLRVEKGAVKTVNDSLKISGVFVSPLANYFINGYILNGHFNAHLQTKNKAVAGTLVGEKFTGTLPLENYPKIMKEALAKADSKIYNRTILTTAAYKDFASNTSEAATKAQDDLEAVFSFFYYVRKLPTSHFALLKTSPSEVDSKKSKQIFLEEKSAQTAYLKVLSFNGSKSEVDSAFNLIYQKNYQNLIIEFRGNSGGTVEAGMALSNHLFDSTFLGGVFLTQNWFNNNTLPPSESDFGKFPYFSASNYNLIMAGIHATDGLCLKIIPNTKTFKGKLFILTDITTASTCEPIVYALKQKNKATIIGQTTAGAMMNGEKFELSNGFSIYIPTADYYAADGFRIDQKGIKPTVETKPELALEQALKLIK